MVHTGVRRWSWQNTKLGELVSEFLGTFTLIVFGDGSVAMVVSALNQSGRGKTLFLAQADWLIIAWGWGLAVAFGVWIAGGLSGAHINPAVTLGFAVRRKFPWNKVGPYWAAQVLGAFVGGYLIYLNYKASIDSFNTVNHAVRGQPSSLATYSIFATFPAPYFHAWWGPFIDQVIGTGFLVALVFAILDEFNMPAKGNMAPLMIGLVVVGIGLSLGANAGYAINPARDFGPRMVALIEGWGKIAFPGDYAHIGTYFWIPIVGPLVGGVLGAVGYDVGIRNFLMARAKKTEAEAEAGVEYDEPHAPPPPEPPPSA